MYGVGVTAVATDNTSCQTANGVGSGSISGAGSLSGIVMVDETDDKRRGVVLALEVENQQCDSRNLFCRQSTRSAVRSSSQVE